MKLILRCCARTFTLLMILGICIVSPQEAQAKSQTFNGHHFDRCKSKNGPSGFVIAWYPGVWVYCYGGKGALPALERNALFECNKRVKRILRSVKRKGKCRLAYAQGKSVDPVYTKSLTHNPRHPVTIRIFDDESQKLQETAGIFQLRNSRNSARRAPYSFTLKAKGVEICEGQYVRGKRGKTTFSSTCFGQVFRGKSPAGKAVDIDDMVILLPSKVRVEHEGSWLEILF